MPYNIEYIKENKPVKLSEENHDFLVGYISTKWDEWDSVRRSSLDAINAVEKAIYPTFKSNASKININMPEIYEIRETYKAHLWKSWFSSLDSMFDVQGKSQEDNANAPNQKASLINVFRQTELASKLERGVDNWINKGEFIAFINWTTKIKKTRKKEFYKDNNNLLSIRSGIVGDDENFGSGYSFFNEKLQEEEDSLNEFRKPENKDITERIDPRGNKSGTQKYNSESAMFTYPPVKFVIKDEIIYDGPDITIVTPEAFVFDPSKKENFETCPKIYRSWATFDEIQANTLYKNIDSLNEICSKKGESDSSCYASGSQGNNRDAQNRAYKGDQLEILEYWGDVKLKDGTLLKNQVITLAGRKKIIRFEDNPFISNPFVFAAFHEDPVTKRGYSPLYIALPLNEASEAILNLQLDALRLIINKPYLAPKGALSGKINIKEGSIIEYDPSLMPTQPVPLDFKDAIVGWDFLRFFESKIESTTGIFKYMTGDPSAVSQRTATEASGLMASQNIRISKEIDFLNQNIKLPIIRKIAELIANFSFDISEIKITKENGDIEFVFIDESIRQGNYDYLIGDSNAAFEKKTKLKESLNFLFEVAKHPEVAPKIKWIEVMKWAFGQIGSVDPNMFIRDSKI